MKLNILSVLVMVVFSLNCSDNGSTHTCVDHDEDGYGTGDKCQGPDCNDSDPHCHEGDCCIDDCTDLDGDGYGAGPDCQGSDCNDSDPECWEGECCPEDYCIDLDEDGYGIGEDCQGSDCNDLDPECWEGECCPERCIDLDGDGYGIGEECQGSDCNDLDPECWEGECCPEQPLMVCLEILVCVEVCEEAFGEEELCEFICLKLGNEESQGLYNDLENCMQENNCQDYLQDYQCIIENCLVELRACTVDAG